MRMRILLVVALLGQTAAPPPDTEVFLAPLSVRGNKVEIGTPINISNNPGYDNQPSFTPDGKAVLFTSVRGERKPNPANSAATGSDIYRYDIANQRLSQVTNTSEAEVLANGDARSASHLCHPRRGRWYAEAVALRHGREDEWTREGERARARAARHQARRIPCVGERQDPGAVRPRSAANLQVADTHTGRARVAAKGIGRSIQRIPRGGISFVLRAAPIEGEPPMLTISELDPRTLETRQLVRAPAGAAEADTAWTPDGLLLVPFQGHLFGWRRGQAEMSPVVDLAPLGLRTVTRLAISPKGDRIALVAQKP